jgi:uncharacterized repeat protein (TIGR02543 family)
MKTQSLTPGILDFPNSSVTTIDIRIDNKELEILTEDCTCIIDEVEFVKILDLETKMPLPVVSAQPLTKAKKPKNMPEFISRIFNRFTLLPLTLPFCFLFLLGVSIFWGQSTITSWGFEGGSPLLGGNNTPSPTSGAGTTSIVGSMTGGGVATGMNTISGCGVQISGTNAWAIATANPGSSNESSGVRFNTSTVGYENIKFQWEQRWSGTATNTVRLQYTTDGINWTNFTMTSLNTTFCDGSIDNGRFETNTTADRYRRITVDLSGVSGVSNNANFGVRILAAHFRSTGQFRQVANTTSTATGGTWRFDNVSISGTALITYNVSYNSNANTSGTAPLDGTNYSSGSLVTVLGNTGGLVRIGYTFAGWNTMANGSGMDRSEGSTFTITANTTLFAKWTANINTITFDGNGFTGGSTSSQNINTASSANLTANGFTRSGYTFAGWNTASDGTGIFYADQESYTMGTTSVTLYAQWTANSLLVTYNSQGGSFISNGSTTVGGTVSNPGNPTRSGYLFNGWFTDSIGGTAVSFPFTHGQTSDFTLFAQWAVAATPVIDPVSLVTALSSTYGIASTGVSFTVSGSNLTSNVSVNAQLGYEVSTIFDSGYGESVLVASGTTVYVRFVSGLPVGSYDNTIVVLLSGGGTSSSSSVATSSFGNTVSKATPTIVSAPTASVITFGQTLESSILTGGSASVAGSFVFTTPLIAPNAGTTNQSVTFIPTDNANFNEININVSVLVNKSNQTITFGVLADKVTSDLPFSLNATASSGLIVSYSSSNTSVATISGSTVTIVGTGSTTITASQAGNSNYNSAADVLQIQFVALGGYYWNGGSIIANPANGGTGSWGTSNVWRQPTATGSQASWINGNNAVFAGSAGIVSIGSNYSSTVYVNTNNYTFTPDATTTRTISGNLFLADNVNLNLNDLSQTANRTIGIGGNISGGTNSKITILVNQTGSNSSRLNLAASGATLSVPVEISVGTTSSNYGNVAIVGTASNTIISKSITNNSSYKTTIGATSGNSLSVNDKITGSATLMFAAGSSGGAGTITLNANSDYTGATYFNAASSNGVIRLGINNALPIGTDVTMGYSAGNGGVFDLNGFNQTISSLSNGAGDGSLRNNFGTSTLTINGSSSTVFSLPITNTGILNIVRSGTGATMLTGACTYTGTTTVSGGTLRFNRSGGTTIPATNNVIINGGILQISSDQILNNITVSSGTLRVDSGVTLTITGIFTGGGTIENNGTIIIVGPSSFPGSTSTISAMNHLTINNSVGVTLDKSITITGLLNLTSGTLTLGDDTLTINGSISRISGNINASSLNSGVVFSGTISQSIPTSCFIGEISNLILNNSAGLSLNQDITISNILTITNGTLDLSTSNLILAADCSISIPNPSISNMILTSSSGELRKRYNQGNNQNPLGFLFPIGTSGSYTPVHLDFLNANFGSEAYLRVRVEPSKSSHLSSSIASYLNRNWIIEPNHISNYTYDIRLKYSASDFIAGGLTEDELIPIKYSNGQWNQPAGLIEPFTNATNESSNYFLFGSSTTDPVLNSNRVILWGGLQSFSEFGGAGQTGQPLPVELISFNASCLEELIMLTWQTASEFNSSHFDIEKSRDGQTWNVICQQNAAGNSNELLSYQFVDAEKNNSTVYYRLNQVDMDGKNEYFAPISISCNQYNFQVSTFPNPSEDYFFLNINSDQEQLSIIKIRDMKSQLILKEDFKLKNGINLIKLQPAISNGIYFIEIETEQGDLRTIKHQRL